MSRSPDYPHFLDDGPRPVLRRASNIDPAVVVTWDKRTGFAIGEPTPAHSSGPRGRGLLDAPPASLGWTIVFAALAAGMVFFLVALGLELL